MSEDFLVVFSFGGLVGFVWAEVFIACLEFIIFCKKKRKFKNEK